LRAAAEPLIRVELEAVGLTNTQEFDDAVATNFDKIGDMEICLFSRFHERVVAFIINFPGLANSYTSSETLTH